jgi:hypothetical protein
MKTYGGIEVQTPHILKPGAGRSWTEMGAQLQFSGALPPEKVIRRIGGSVTSETVFEWWRRNIPCLCREMNPDLSPLNQSLF